MAEKKTVSRKELFDELLAAHGEGLTIRNGECRKHVDEPCEVCSQWNSESRSCGLADKLNALSRKLDDGMKDGKGTNVYRMEQAVYYAVDVIAEDEEDD